jgi:GTP-dependent phosphoenolpyruvate carboxykinase
MFGLIKTKIKPDLTEENEVLDQSTNKTKINNLVSKVVAKEGIIVTETKVDEDGTVYKEGLDEDGQIVAVWSTNIDGIPD